MAAQTAGALLVSIADAHLSVTEVEFVSAAVLNVSAALIAPLLAPLAIELPEKSNSAVWIAEGKDTLAIGNATGAMVIQGTLPAAPGILFTSWDLGVVRGTTGFLNTPSAVLAIVGASLVLLRSQWLSSNRMAPVPFLATGPLSVVFIAAVVYLVVVLGVPQAVVSGQIAKRNASARNESHRGGFTLGRSRWIATTVPTWPRPGLGVATVTPRTL